MPFKSEKQRRYLWANEPEIARDWTDTYGSRIQKNRGGIMSMQGGVKNYLGKQPMVSAPKYWQSSPDHPTTELAYITPAEKDLLVKQDLHGSLKGGVNKGPSGIISLNGWGDADQGFGMSDKGKGISGTGGHSYGDKERTVSTTRGTPRGNTITTTKTVSPKDHFTQSWTGPKGLFSGGYKNLKVPGQTQHGHKSGIGSLLLGGLLSVINPALGMAYRGYKGLQGFTDKFGNKIGDWRENLTGYRTQKEWEDARKQRQLQSRFDKLMDRKLSGKNYSQKNLDMLSAMGINPSKNSLAAALARDANQSMNMFDGPFSRTHLQSVAEGLPPMFNNQIDQKVIDVMTTNPDALTYAEVLANQNRAKLTGPYRSPMADPMWGGIMSTPQGIAFNNPVGGVDQFAKEVVDLEKSAYPVGGTPYRVDQLGGTLEDYFRNKIPSSITGYQYADKGLPGHSRINVSQPYRGI